MFPAAIWVVCAPQTELGIFVWLKRSSPQASNPPSFLSNRLCQLPGASCETPELSALKGRLYDKSPQAITRLISIPLWAVSVKLINAAQAADTYGHAAPFVKILIVGDYQASSGNTL